MSKIDSIITQIEELGETAKTVSGVTKNLKSIFSEITENEKQEIMKKLTIRRIKHTEKQKANLININYFIASIKCKTKDEIEKIFKERKIEEKEEKEEKDKDKQKKSEKKEREKKEKQKKEEEIKETKKNLEKIQKEKKLLQKQLEEAEKEEKRNEEIENTPTQKDETETPIINIDPNLPKPYAPESEKIRLNQNLYEFTDKRGLTFKIGEAVTYITHDKKREYYGKITGFSGGQNKGDSCFIYTEKSNQDRDQRASNVECFEHATPEEIEKGEIK